MEGVAFPDGSPYQPTRCWYDLYQALENAQKFIYITGWSVYTEIQLVRGEDDPDGLSNVGALLKGLLLSHSEISFPINKHVAIIEMNKHIVAMILLQYF